MDIKKYYGTSKFFAALVITDENKSAILFGKTNTPMVDVKTKCEYALRNTEILSTLEETMCKIEIPFIAFNKRLYNIICLDDEREYDIILKILECIYD